MDLSATWAFTNVDIQSLQHLITMLILRGQIEIKNTKNRGIDVEIALFAVMPPLPQCRSHFVTYWTASRNISRLIT